MASGFFFGAKSTAAPAFGIGSISFGTPTTWTQNASGGFATQTAFSRYLNRF